MATLQWDYSTKTGTVLSPDTVITLQEIHDQTADWLEEPGQMFIRVFIKSEGKILLGTGEFSPIIITLFDGWKLDFAVTTGLRQVSGGTLRGDSGTLTSPANDNVSPIVGANRIEVEKSFSGSSLSDVSLTRKMLTNRRELADGTTANLIVYDDDDLTPLLTFDVTDETDSAIALAAGDPAKQSKGT